MLRVKYCGISVIVKEGILSEVGKVIIMYIYRHALLKTPYGGVYFEGLPLYTLYAFL